MIVDLENGTRARVIMLRNFNTAATVALQVESDQDLVPLKQTVNLTAREARKIASYLLWLAVKIEEEES